MGNYVPQDDVKNFVLGYLKRITREKAMGKGGRCPCCDQFVKVYKRTITSVMAAQLIDAHNRFAFTKFHIGDLKTARKTGGGDFAKLQYWGLIAPADVDAFGKHKSGMWKLTHDGRLFAMRMLEVPKYALIYNGKRIGVDDEKTVDIVDALQEKFDYDELMKPAA